MCLLGEFHYCHSPTHCGTRADVLFRHAAEGHIHHRLQRHSNGGPVDRWLHGRKVLTHSVGMPTSHAHDMKGLTEVCTHVDL